MINNQFINTWMLEYDVIENDEPEYLKLIEQSKLEIQADLTLTKKTFNRILDWKSSRVKGITKKYDYLLYANAIAELRSIDDHLKIYHLTNLPGFGAPVASTFLHFIYPTLFPIIDRRTVDALVHFSKLRSKSTDVSEYKLFSNAIFSISNDCKGNFTLREIDKALFAFHKSKTDIFGSLTKPSKKLVPRVFKLNKEKSLSNHEMIQIAVCLNRGDVLSVAEIKKKVMEIFPQFKSGSLLPNDHAKGNKGSCPCVGSKRQIFDKVENIDGLYIVC